MPKRSASRMTITVALGTSTPTSITVVATNTSRRPGRKVSMTASFSTAGIRPWSSPTRSPDSSPAVELLAGLLGRPGLELLALVDQRADHVGLTAGGDLVADLFPHVGLVELAPGPSG